MNLLKKANEPDEPMVIIKEEMFLSEEESHSVDQEYEKVDRNNEGKETRDLGRVQQDMRDKEVVIGAKKPAFIKSKEKTEHMGSKVDRAKKSLLSQTDSTAAKMNQKLKEKVGKDSARYMSKSESINREHRGDQDKLDNENRKKLDVESKLKNKGHEQEEGKKRLGKLNDHIRASKTQEQRTLLANLSEGQGSSKSGIDDPTADARVDNHDIIPPLSAENKEADDDRKELVKKKQYKMIREEAFWKLCHKHKVTEQNIDSCPEGVREKLQLALKYERNAEESLADFLDFLKNDKYKKWNDEKKAKMEEQGVEGEHRDTDSQGAGEGGLADQEGEAAGESDRQPLEEKTDHPTTRPDLGEGEGSGPPKRQKIDEDEEEDGQGDSMTEEYESKVSYLFLYLRVCSSVLFRRVTLKYEIANLLLLYL